MELEDYRVSFFSFRMHQLPVRVRILSWQLHLPLGHPLKSLTLCPFSCLLWILTPTGKEVCSREAAPSLEAAEEIVALIWGGVQATCALEFEGHWCKPTRVLVLYLSKPDLQIWNKEGDLTPAVSSEMSLLWSPGNGGSPLFRCSRMMRDLFLTAALPFSQFSVNIRRIIPNCFPLIST